MVALPLVLIAGGVLFSVTSTLPFRNRIRHLLQDQRRLAKSFVRCLCDKDLIAPKWSQIAHESSQSTL